jgi:hypothetical protein
VIGSAALVAVVVAVLTVTHWTTVRDHVEAWRFQLTRETRTIQPLSSDWYPMEEHLLHFAADRLRCPVIVDRQDLSAFFGVPAGNILDVLDDRGWRVLEQRVPRRSYVLIRAYDRPIAETWVIPGFGMGQGAKGQERP